MATMKTLNGYGFNATELNGKTSDSYLQLGDDGTGSTGEAPKINADTLGGVAASNYLKKTDTATNSAKLGGKAPEYYIQPRNLLDNSDFRHPVNQREKTSYSGTTYTIDRWLIQTDTGTASIGNNGLTLATNDSTSCKIMQYVEKLDFNKVYTFVIKDTNENVYLIHSVPNERNEEKTSFGSMIVNMTNLNNDNKSAFSISLDPGTTITMAWAALYEGSYTVDTLPPYVPKGYVTELAECRRYAKYTTATLAGIAHGYDSGKAYAAIFTSGPKMRINPSVDDYSKIQIINGEWYSDTFNSITGISTISTHYDSITFWIESSEISAGKDYYISCGKGVLFSADL